MRIIKQYSKKFVIEWFLSGFVWSWSIILLLIFVIKNNLARKNTIVRILWNLAIIYSCHELVIKYIFYLYRNFSNEDDHFHKSSSGEVRIWLRKLSHYRVWQPPCVYYIQNPWRYSIRTTIQYITSKTHIILFYSFIELMCSITYFLWEGYLSF